MFYDGTFSSYVLRGIRRVPRLIAAICFPTEETKPKFATESLTFEYKEGVEATTPGNDLGNTGFVQYIFRRNVSLIGDRLTWLYIVQFLSRYLAIIFANSYDNMSLILLLCVFLYSIR